MSWHTATCVPRKMETLTNFIAYDDKGIKACAGFFRFSFIEGNVNSLEADWNSGIDYWSGELDWTIGVPRP